MRSSVYLLPLLFLLASSTFEFEVTLGGKAFPLAATKTGIFVINVTTPNAIGQLYTKCLNTDHFEPDSFIGPLWSTFGVTYGNPVVDNCDVGKIFVLAFIGDFGISVGPIFNITVVELASTSSVVNFANPPLPYDYHNTRNAMRIVRMGCKDSDGFTRIVGIITPDDEISVVPYQLASFFIEEIAARDYIYYAVPANSNVTFESIFRIKQVPTGTNTSAARAGDLFYAPKSSALTGTYDLFNDTTLVGYAGFVQSNLIGVPVSVNLVTNFVQSYSSVRSEFVPTEELQLDTPFLVIAGTIRAVKLSKNEDVGVVLLNGVEKLIADGEFYNVFPKSAKNTTLLATATNYTRLNIDDNGYTGSVVWSQGKKYFGLSVTSPLTVQLSYPHNIYVCYPNYDRSSTSSTRLNNPRVIQLVPGKLLYVLLDVPTINGTTWEFTVTKVNLTEIELKLGDGLSSSSLNTSQTWTAPFRLTSEIPTGERCVDFSAYVESTYPYIIDDGFDLLPINDYNGDRFSVCRRDADSTVNVFHLVLLDIYPDIPFNITRAPQVVTVQCSTEYTTPNDTLETIYAYPKGTYTYEYLIGDDDFEPLWTNTADGDLYIAENAGLASTPPVSPLFRVKNTGVKFSTSGWCYTESYQLYCTQNSDCFSKNCLSTGFCESITPPSSNTNPVSPTQGVSGSSKTVASFLLISLVAFLF